jgi:hypothetical protein
MGRHTKDKDIGRSDKRGKAGAEKPEPPPAPAFDDELYETGDIAAPERDRDDEQRGL